MGRAPGFKRNLPLLALAAVVVGGGGAVYWWVFLRLTPEEVLRRMRQAYSTAETFEERTRFTISTKSGPTELKASGKTHLLFSRPNKLRHVTEVELRSIGKSREVTVCDGKHLYREVSVLKQVLKAEAPKDVSQILAGEEVFVTETALLTGKDPAPLVRSATLKRGGRQGGVRTALLELELKRGGKERLWVGLDDFFIRRVEVVMSQSSMGMSITTTLVETMEFIKANHPIPEGQFAYSPPKGFKVVSKFELPKPKRSEGSEWEGKEAPDFELTSLDGRRKVKLSDLRGKVVLLDFWASWCGPCREELPHIEKIHKELSGKGLVVLGINDEPPDVAKKFVKEQGLTFTTLHDDGGKVHRLYGVEFIPTTIIVGRDGKVVERFVGYTEEGKIREALKRAGFK